MVPLGEQRQLLLVAMRAGYELAEACAVAGVELAVVDQLEAAAADDPDSSEAAFMAELAEAEGQTARAKLMAEAVLRSYGGDTSRQGAIDFLYHLESQRQYKRARELTTY